MGGGRPKAFWARELKSGKDMAVSLGNGSLSPEEAEGRCLAEHSATDAQAGHSCQAKGTMEGMLIINSAVLS